MNGDGMNIDEMIIEVLKESRDSPSAGDNGWVMFQQELNFKVIRELYDKRDQFPIFDLSLRGICEHLYVAKQLTDDLEKALGLLEENNIPFNSILVTKKK